MKNRKSVKNTGQVFTPKFLVSEILDFVGYTQGGISRQHVIDNSCGNGAFLCEVAERYIVDFVATNGTANGVESELATYIHGIELDGEAHSECLTNLDAMASKWELGSVKWDVRHADALSVSDFDGRMAFVVGNPPYVRVHNLEDNYQAVKQFAFADSGMTDIYLVFFEIGFRMLSPSGRLCYITPSSWLSSLAASPLRGHIAQHQTLSGLIDLGHFQAFEGATTYTLISRFDMSERHENIDYYSYDSENRQKNFVDTLRTDDMAIGANFYLSNRETLQEVRQIRTKPARPLVRVKNGFATLADKVFIDNVDFEPLTIPILKASTGKWQRGFYPYDKKGKPLAKNEIFSHPEIADYLARHKPDLLKGKTETQMPEWYLYGRTQALKDVWANKIAISTIVKDVASIKLNLVPSGSGLYSGLYILTDLDFETIESIVKNENFMAYLRLLKNYKSGGYYTFNSKDLEVYINFVLSNDDQYRHLVSSHEQRFSQGYIPFV